MIAPTSELRVVVQDSPPFVYKEGDEWAGYDVDVLEQVARRVGFTFEVTEAHGYEELLDVVRSGRADLAMGGLTATSAREKTLDFTSPDIAAGLQVMVRTDQATGLGGVAQAFLTSSVINLLLLGFFCLLMVANLIWIIQFLRGALPERGYIRGVIRSMHQIFVNMATLDFASRTPRSVWGRLGSILGVVLSLVFIAQLTALLTASLTVSKVRGGIDSVDDLRGKVVATVANSTSVDSLSRRGIKAAGYPSLSAALVGLNQGKADAVVYDAPMLKYEEGRSSGNFRVVGPVIDRQWYGFAMRPNNRYLESINQAILSLQENGVLERLHSQWLGG
ncbi:amino acid ABC transporter ATP-binding protein [Streptomyces sp. NBRC 110611]|nr:amino acid ABC transporter ATP-binding protein [Streptomyces sp. NBRC 110611]